MSLRILKLYSNTTFGGVGRQTVHEKVIIVLLHSSHIFIKTHCVPHTSHSTPRGGQVTSVKEIDDPTCGESRAELVCVKRLEVCSLHLRAQEC